MLGSLLSLSSMSELECKTRPNSHLIFLGYVLDCSVLSCLSFFSIFYFLIFEFFLVNFGCFENWVVDSGLEGRERGESGFGFFSPGISCFPH